MLKKILFALIISTASICIAQDQMFYANNPSEANQFVQFTGMLSGETHALNQQQQQYNQMVQDYWQKFKQNFVEPISNFHHDHLASLTNNRKSLFYPFGGPDISYPLLLFPNVEQYILIGLEHPGQPAIIQKEFGLQKFQPQVQGFLTSGFFKTMKMSAQISYQQGVIPVLMTQIGLLGGKVQNIEAMEEPYNGIAITFIHNNLYKRAYYFRANLDDYNKKEHFFEFMKQNQLLDSCMIKASSYKLHQIEFNHLRKFVLDQCPLIIQDDTGMPAKHLAAQNRRIHLFGKYIQPYGSEFTPYHQPELVSLYNKQESKPELNFCFGYGCKRVEANILVAVAN